MSIATRFLISCVILTALADIAAAQQFAVQQPVFHNFSVGTAVSVPDRGRAVMGGVSRAGSSRATYGPPRLNTNTGMFAERSGVSAHVTIHDFAEMDRRALSGASSRAREDNTKLNGHAAHAYQVLQSRAARR